MLEIANDGMMQLDEHMGRTVDDIFNYKSSQDVCFEIPSFHHLI
jgi:hypothetical protein